MNNEPVITIVGNIGKPPDLRYAPNGNAVLTFSMALYTGGSKDKGYKESVWVRVTAWEELAETMNEVLDKGMRVRVAGIPQPPRTYDKDGEKVSAGLEVTAQTIEVVTREN